MPINELDTAAARQDYTALVCMRCTTPGNVSAVQPGDGVWGRKEVPPVFQRVRVTATKPEIEWLRENGQYDPRARAFKHKGTGDDFDPEFDVVGDEEFDLSPERERRLAVKLNGGVEPAEEPCLYLRPRHLGDNNDGRFHFLRAFYPHRKLPGVKRLLRIVKRGLHLDLREGLLSLSDDVLTVVLRDLSPEDKIYLVWLCWKGDRVDD
jgi:hypothetical protein